MRFFLRNYVISPLYFLPQIFVLRLKRQVLLFHRLKLGLVARGGRYFFQKISNPTHDGSLLPNGSHHLPAEAGEARCSRSGACEN